MAGRVNKGIEQVRNFMGRQIIPELERIFKRPKEDMERVVLEEYLKDFELDQFKGEEYASGSVYSTSYQRCLNNLFQTRS